MSKPCVRPSLFFALKLGLFMLEQSPELEGATLTTRQACCGALLKARLLYIYRFHLDLSVSLIWLLDCEPICHQSDCGPRELEARIQRPHPLVFSFS